MDQTIIAVFKIPVW